MSDITSPDDEVAIKWKMQFDEDSKKQSDNAFKNMTSLLADLSIVAKVASDALSKVWSGLQSQVSASLKEFDDVNAALTFNVDPEDLMVLKYALDKSGSDSKQAVPILSEVDSLIQAFRNTATNPDAIKKFFTDNALYNVSDAKQEELQGAIDDGDAIELVKIFGSLRDELGDEYNNFAKQVNLPALSKLEIDFQNIDWNEAFSHMGEEVFKVDTEGLDKLEDGIADLAAASRGLKTTIGATLGPSIETLGANILDMTNRLLGWFDGFKDANPELMDDVKEFVSIDMDVISGDKTIVESALDNVKLAGDILKGTHPLSEVDFNNFEDYSDFENSDDFKEPAFIRKFGGFISGLFGGGKDDSGVESYNQNSYSQEYFNSSSTQNSNSTTNTKSTTVNIDKVEVTTDNLEGLKDEILTEAERKSREISENTARGMIE